MANKVKRRRSATNMGEVVLASVKKLMKNTGWTTRFITKFIRTEYGNADPRLGRKVNRALKRGVKLGLLQTQSGRYRLSKISGLAKRVSSREIRRRQLQKLNRNKTLRIRSSD